MIMEQNNRSSNEQILNEENKLSDEFYQRLILDLKLLNDKENIIYGRFSFCQTLRRREQPKKLN